MTKSEDIQIRAVERSDLDAFFAHQLDPEAIRLAAFVHPDGADRSAFDRHWHRILASPQNVNRTILVNGQVAGHVACYPWEGNTEVTYWLGREFWGRGIATEALKQLLATVVQRPITARAATDNFGSLRVLAKCGFTIVGRDQGFAHGRGTETEEYLLRLDRDSSPSMRPGLEDPAHLGSEP